MLRIKLVRSLVGQTKRNRATVAALGLRKMHQVVEHEDTGSIRGMVHHVKHMLSVEEVEGSPNKKKAAAKVAAPAKPAKESKPKAAKAEAAPAENVVEADAPTTEEKPKAKRTTKKAEAEKE
jgi:large subunit ribosomal protein L30